MLKQYAAKAAKYAVYPKRGECLAYPLTGLAEELLELGDAVTSRATRSAVVYEAGDCLWYLVETVHGLEQRTGLQLFDDLLVGPFDTPRPGFHETLRGLVGAAKRELRGDWADNPGELFVRVGPLLITAYFFVVGALSEQTASVEMACDANLKKLERRWNDGTIKGSGDNR